jgi:hypothetical protein
MKRCPTCERTFEDETLRFCPDDGAELVSPIVTNSDPQTVPAYGGLGGKATWSASADQIPELQKYMATTTIAPKTRKVWPWIVGVVAMLLLLGALLLIAVSKMR